MSSDFSTVFWYSLYVRTQHGLDDDVEYREEDEDEEQDEMEEADEDGVNTNPHRYFMQEQDLMNLSQV